MRRFQYCIPKKRIGKGGYGKVELIEVSAGELIRCRRRRQQGLKGLSLNLNKSSKYRRRQYRRRSSSSINNNNHKIIQIARKIFRHRNCKNSFAMEIHNYKKLPNSLRKKYFINMYRAYKTCVTHCVIHISHLNTGGVPIKEFEQPVFKSKYGRYCIELEYLDSQQWLLLGKYFNNITTTDNDIIINDKIRNIFFQLLQFQLDLLIAGGIYYDMSPKNVFVCKNTDRIKLIDYGALFFPLKPKELHKRMNRKYTHQRVVNPIYFNVYPSRREQNTTYYDNNFFPGSELNLAVEDVTPAFFGLITTICTCLYLVKPKKSSAKNNLHYILHKLLDVIDIEASTVTDIFNSPEKQTKMIKSLLSHSNLTQSLQDLRFC